MMRLSVDAFLATAGVGKGTFAAEVSRDQVGLAFGTAAPLSAGNFLDLDAIAWLVLKELTPAFGAKLAATLVRRFSDQWLGAVAMQEEGPDDGPVFLLVAEFGSRLASDYHAVYEDVNVTAGRLGAFGDFDHRKVRKVPRRMTLVNMAVVIDTARRNAKAAGVVLPDRLVPALDDPEFAAVRAATREARETARQVILR